MFRARIDPNGRWKKKGNVFIIEPCYSKKSWLTLTHSMPDPSANQSGPDPRNGSPNFITDTIRPYYINNSLPTLVFVNNSKKKKRKKANYNTNLIVIFFYCQFFSCKLWGIFLKAPINKIISTPTNSNMFE